MAVNMYDEAAPVQYVSQYVPIPFQELFAMAKYYGDEIKTARKELNEYAKSVGEFQSLLTKDVDSYHRIALNDNIRRIMDEAVANPSVMKSAAWRSGMAGALNSVDYASLSKLKKSAEQADLYDKLYKSLAAQGKMPPGWEKDWYSTYDTLAEQKIFDKTPLPYSSVEDVAYSYVDELKDTHLGSHGGYNWYGVDEDIALRQVRERESELLADQYVNRHYEILREAGLTDQEALQEIRNRANTAALRAVRMKPVLDPYVMAATQAKYALDLAREKNAGKGNKNGITGVLGIEDMLAEDSRIKKSDMVSRAEQNPEFIQKYLPQRTQIGTGLQNAIESYQADPLFKENFDKYLTYLENNGYAGNDAVIAATGFALNQPNNISEQNKALFTSLMDQDRILKQQMTEEAIGRNYISSFNNTVGNTNPDANVFTQLKNATENEWFGSTEFFDEAAYQHMWRNAIVDTMVEISPDTGQLFNKELYGEEISKNDIGFKETPKNLVSPKQFISGTNSYVQNLMAEAGINNIGSIKLNRSATRAGDTAQFDLEERAVRGDFGELRTEQILGYIDTPDARNYVVRVRIPIGDNSAFEKKMSAWAAADDMQSATRNAGYMPMYDENGNPFINLTLIKPVKNKGVDKTIRNRRYQKNLGTTDTKNAQITLDDIALQSLGYGYDISGGFDYEQ